MPRPPGHRGDPVRVAAALVDAARELCADAADAIRRAAATVQAADTVIAAARTARQQASQRRPPSAGEAKPVDHRFPRHPDSLTGHGIAHPEVTLRPGNFLARVTMERMSQPNPDPAAPADQDGEPLRSNGDVHTELGDTIARVVVTGHSDPKHIDRAINYARQVEGITEVVVEHADDQQPKQ